MIKKVERVYAMYRETYVAFYTYHTDGRPCYLTSVDRNQNLWKCGEEALKRLPESLHCGFISAFLRAMKRACENPLVLTIEKDGTIAICEQDGTERVRFPKTWDLNDVIAHLKRMRNNAHPGSRKFAEDILRRLFCGMRRFNKPRNQDN